MPYTLIISEKPKAAFRIAQSLADGRVESKKNDEGAVYYTITRGGKTIIVVPAVGHLFGLKQASKGWKYPVFDVVWKPIYENKRSAYTKKYFDNIASVAKGASEYIVATDYDTEGDVIATNILSLICNQPDAKRMKFSTLVKSELEDSYNNVLPTMDRGQVNAGLARHVLDWYYGINTSRALSLAMKAAGRFFVLSTGRVQGPALGLLAEREKEIKAFIPVPFWEIELHFTSGNEKLVAQHEKDKFWDKKESSKIVADCRDKDAVVTDIERKKYKQKPPVPFDLTTLQSESYRWFGYTPVQTQNLAQSLYESGLISYPRTSSQKLPEQLGLKAILEQLSKQRSYSKLAKEILSKPEIKPNEGEKADPAHPSIFPTGEMPQKITAQQEKLYDLIVKRFLAVFAEEATRESVKYTLSIGENNFNITGKTTINDGWLKFCKPYISAEDLSLPDFQKGDSFSGSVEMLSKETQPPKRFNEASLVKELESRSLGTKATRATIVRTLFSRGYVLGKSIEVSDLGMTVADTLNKYSPEILSEELTRSFEVEMEKIQTGEVKKEKIISEAEVLLEKTLTNFKKNEKEIGETLLAAFITMRRAAKLIGKCPNCEKGELKIIRSMKSGKRFIGCSSYPDCKTGFPLPQTGIIEPLKQDCARCGKPMIVVRRIGRVFRNCIDMNCKPPGKTGAVSAETPAKTTETAVSADETIKATEANIKVKASKPRKRKKLVSDESGNNL